MEKIIYTNANGQSITLDYTGDYILEDFLGFESADIDADTSQGYNQQGKTVNRISIGEREMELNISIFGNDKHKKKAKLDKVFNPIIGIGTLTYTNDYQSKMIQCYTTETPNITSRKGNIWTITVVLTAYNPYFMDSGYQVAAVQDYSGGLKFPIKGQQHLGQKGVTTTIDNDGDVETPCIIEFSGLSYAPHIELDNGEFIRVDINLTEGDRLLIDTSYGNKSVTYIAADGTESSAFNYINVNSSFFSLPVGKTKIKFGSDTGAPVCKIYWRRRYLGV